MTFYEIVNSTMLQTIVILITVIIAIVKIITQNKQKKKEAAIIVLGEIQYAENAIDELKRNNQIIESNEIMPVNSWISYRHLLISALAQEEITHITNFYNKCIYAEKYRKMYYDMRNESIIEKAKQLQKKLIDLIIEDIKSGDKNYEKHKKELINKANNEKWLFDAELPRVLITDYLKDISYITSSTSGSKLRKVAKR